MQFVSRLKISAFWVLSNKFAAYSTVTLILKTIDGDKKIFSTACQLGTMEFLRVVCTDRPCLVLVLLA